MSVVLYKLGAGGLRCVVSLRCVIHYPQHDLRRSGGGRRLLADFVLAKIAGTAGNMPSEFPAEIDLFIGQHIESLAQLEALLTLRGEPKRGWNCADLARQLYVPSDVCNGIVVELERRGFVMRDTANPDVFYYRPGSEETDRLIGRLAELYQERRVAVITQIYSKPVKKVQTFADAFRLRKEP